jgi:hypothetical protein
MYFRKFPKIDYQFSDDMVRNYTNLTIRPAVVEEVLSDYSNLESYTVQDKDTPETLAFDRYGDVNLHWVIMLTNNILNIYEDWPLTESALEEHLIEKYRYQEDSDGVMRKLTDLQVLEFISFVGNPTNNYTSYISVQDSDDAAKVVIRPRHFVDDEDNIYSLDTLSNNIDAFGRFIDYPMLFPVSIQVWESNLNDAKREIVIPLLSVAKKMDKELRDLVNE